MTRLVLLAAIVGCGGDSPEGALPPCVDHNPERGLFWGDLHVHTALSFDAWIYDVRLGPEDAYGFARGDEVWLPPVDATGAGTVRAQLDRPLDFAAVTDHSEYLAEVAACSEPGPAYDLPICVDYRAATAQSIQQWGTAFVPDLPVRFDAICSVIDCPRDAQDTWGRIRDAAEAALDRTDRCSFTSFVGYEWSATPGVSNLHRNVIFRNADVPAMPVSTFEAATPDQLWRSLDALCADRVGACEAIAIPHNPNQSNGHLFPLDFAGAEDAARQARREPLLEVFQHKGESECRNGLSGILGAEDELCDFEKLRGPELPDDCGELPGSGGMANFGCEHRVDYARGALLRGIELQRAIGANPYPLGLIASTDTHSGTPGNVAEDRWPGHLGRVEGTPEGRLAYPALNPGGIRNNPGGLVAVWATENRRDALFDALKRREVYGTSGPRITVRMFGGDLPAELCAGSDLVARADAVGVPMGGELVTAKAPTFAVSALMDPGTADHPGRGLQRIQLVKGWVDAVGSHVAVYDVATEPMGAVDLDSCAVDDVGAASLCATFTDPDWSADQDAFWYARVLEQPTCRWSWHDCLSIPEAERPASCADPTVDQAIQERAWTSPIFVSSK